MDIISQLSDDLLLRILSFVPAKEVIATSLLSKRWQSLWMLMPKLDYDDSNHSGDYKSFWQFVYRSLHSNKAPVLKKLRLSLGPDCPSIDIRLWIDFAVSRRVRELDINIRSSKEGSVSLPSSLYTSDTLETLRLSNFVLLSVPFSVSLRSLKDLSLEFVDYRDGDTLPRLLSGCPNLEDLFVDIHKHEAIKGTAVVVPSLKRLTMYDYRLGPCGLYVINVPSLKYLHIVDRGDFNFRQIENMPDLVEAYVDINQKVTHKFLRALTSVLRLSLCLSLSEDTRPSGMIFEQLMHLELYTTSESWWDLLAHMLQASPKLQALKLMDKHYSGVSSKETPDSWKPPSSVIECMLFSLEDFEWNGYKGRQGDEKIATYVLKNAACLKTAKFSPESTDLGEKYKMLKELASVATVGKEHVDRLDEMSDVVL